MALSTTNHDRDAQGMRYAYAVVSRRAGGVSVGINLNPNNACNWACLYCQVPELQRGAAPPIDLELLERELLGLLRDIVEGDFLEREAPPEARRLRDVAISGNGEPTSSEVFDEVIELLGECLEAVKLRGSLAPVLITNGSLIHRPLVLRGLEKLALLGGETWFKLDAGSAQRRSLINDTRLSNAHVARNLGLAARACPTRIQTCVVGIDGEGPSAAARADYVELLRAALRDGVELRGVMLYGLARPSMQPGAERLSRLEAVELETFAEQIRELGLEVVVHP